MKIGTYFAYWEKEWDVDMFKYIKKVKDLGFDILEVCGGGLMELSDEEAKRFGEEAKNEGLMLTCGIGMTAENDTSSEDEAVRQHGIAYAKKLLDKMALAGIHHIGGTLYGYWPVDWTKPIRKEIVREISIKSVRELADYAKPLGINIAVEVLNRFEHFLLNDAKEGVEFVKDVGRDNVYVQLDTFHMNIEEDSFREAILTAGKYLGHFHLGEANRKCPGEGRLPWQEIADALHEIGYDGTVVMEPFVIKGGGVGHDIKIWRDMVEDTTEAALDETIRKSCAFCNKVFNGK